MSEESRPKFDSTPIGEVANPPFVKLPDPAELFRLRAQRFDALAEVHALSKYLRFLARLSDAQHDAQVKLEAPDLPSAETLERARTHRMPPLDRNKFERTAAFNKLFDELLAHAAKIEKPKMAEEALDRIMKMSADQRESMIRNALADSIPLEAIADHLYVAAALQVHYARLASGLDGKKLVPVGDGACPACGAPPVSSAVVGWSGAHNTRFCACSLCATRWHYVRIKCTICASTEGISYQEVEGGPGTVKAETCSKCSSYVKIFEQQKDPSLDPVADDVASLGLDILVRETGFRRGGFNPFLLGY